VNTPYDVNESSILIAKLLPLSRDSKIRWLEDASTQAGLGLVRYQTAIDEDLLVQIWLSNREVGFRLSEKGRGRWRGGDSLGNPPLNVPATSTPDFYSAGRELLAVSISHELGAAQGEIYPNLMSLLELARVSWDKVEPKVDRVKQYLDKLAV
jgi:hypothetical protein